MFINKNNKPYNVLNFKRVYFLIKVYLNIHSINCFFFTNKNMNI